MSRRLLLVCYDVRDPDRLRRVHDRLLGYGDPLQYSVFVCELSGVERALMEKALSEVANLREDSLVVIDLGRAGVRSLRRIQAIGRGRLPERERAIVV